MEQTLKGHLNRFIIFIILYFIGRYPQLLLDLSTFGQTVLLPLHSLLASLITNVCCFILSFKYADIHTSIKHTISIANQTPIQLLPGCTGLDPMIRLTFILLMYPIAWPKKLALWPISMIIIFIAATIHFLILIPISYSYPEHYAITHNWITRVIFYSFYFLCWIIWEKSNNIHKVSY